jgi:2-acylglycerol O-acyltransferase 2
LTSPGQYKFVLKSRKGFVKLAIATGAALVPAITFGEVDLFDTRKSSNFWNFLPLSNVNSFIPKRVSLVTVVGSPMDVEKSENPTIDEIDKVHERFCVNLERLFEDEKSKYIEESEKIKLHIL